MIGVGNLAVGGTGKTPHVEYLANVLKPDYHVGILSRGYARKTNGYIFVSTQGTPKQVGDEPLLYKLKHPDVGVAVSESRVLGVPRLLIDDKDIEVVLLDDVFQHRAIKPGLQILLTDYNRPYYTDAVLPAGLLRESKRGAKRADVIVVTKCAYDLSADKAENMRERINPLPHQKIFFSSYRYGQPYDLITPEKYYNINGKKILLATGIAKPEYLEKHLKDMGCAFHSLNYPDHYKYEERTFYDIQETWNNYGCDAIVLTTEKDAVKWLQFHKLLKELQLPVAVQPIEVSFLHEDKARFDNLVKAFVNNF